MVIDYIHSFQQEVIRSILEKLESNVTTEERVSEIATYILSEFPDTLTKEDLERKIFSLGNTYPELSAVVVKHGAQIEKMQKDEVSIKTVQSLVKMGKVEDATSMIKNILNTYA
ncbi:MAG: hypothetical protein WA061_01200 [Microgenomates group bacterium]